jgi:hypothetical protein
MEKLYPILPWTWENAVRDSEKYARYFVPIRRVGYPVGRRAERFNATVRLDNANPHHA